MRYLTRKTALPLCVFAMTLGLSISAFAATPPESMNAVNSQPSNTHGTDHRTVSNEGYIKVAGRWDYRGYNGRNYRNSRSWSYRGNSRGYYNERRHNRNGINLGAAAAAIFGGVIVNGGSRSRHRSAYQRCDNRYVSFRWSDGTFQPYGYGPRKICPYLF